MFMEDFFRILCQVILSVPFLVLRVLLFDSIAYWMIGLNPDIVVFSIYLGIMILLGNTGISFGYMISCISNNPMEALNLVTPIITPMLLFAGYFLNIASVPIYFIWLKYTSVFYYANEAILINQWIDVYNITRTTTTCVHTGKEVLKDLAFDESHFLRDIILIAVLLLVFRFLAFIVLLIKSSRKM